jgi:hypothetical protein
MEKVIVDVSNNDWDTNFRDLVELDVGFSWTFVTENSDEPIEVQFVKSTGEE